MWSNLMRAAAPDPINGTEDDSNSNNDGSEPSQSAHEEQQQQQQQPLVGGLVGRLTRFVENVTAPDDDDDEYYNDGEEEEHQDGWEQDDDDLVDLQDSEATDPPQTVLQPPNDDPLETVSPIQEEKEQGWVEDSAEGGWGDEDDLDLSTNTGTGDDTQRQAVLQAETTLPKQGEPESSQEIVNELPAPAISSGWNDDDDDDLDVSTGKDAAAPADVAQPAKETPVQADDPDGWNDDDDLDISTGNGAAGWGDEEDLDLSTGNDAPEALEQPPTEPLLNENSDTGIAVENDADTSGSPVVPLETNLDAAGGWDDDDLDISNSGESQLVLDTPANASLESNALQSLKISQPEEEEEEEEEDATLPVQTENEKGWDEDDIDISDSHQEAETTLQSPPVEATETKVVEEKSHEVTAHASDAPMTAGAADADTEAPPSAVEEGRGEDFDASENDAADLADTAPLSADAPPAVGSPGVSGVTTQRLQSPKEVVDHEVNQADQNLQAVLDEISFQEGRDARLLNETMDSALVEDDYHAQQAVSDIQREMDLVQQLQQRQEEQLADRQDPNTSIVDHVPISQEIDGDIMDSGDSHVAGEDNPSLAVLANAEDQSRDTGPVDKSGPRSGMTLSEEQDVFDNENEMEYGPVVDHLPKPMQFARQDSMAPQAGRTHGEDTSGWDEDEAIDLDDDEEDDLGVVQEEDDEIVLVDPAVVDHTPVNSRDIVARDASVGVLASLADTLTAAADDETADEQDAAHAFGPVVDLTPVAANGKVEPPPLAPISGSLAVNALALEEEFREDDEMDETLFGDSTTLDAGEIWDDDEVVFSDENTTVKTSSTEPKPPQPQQQQQVTFSPRLTMLSHLVDHTPSELPGDESTAALADPSLAVLATDEDLTRDSGSADDEEVYDDENEMEYGPVVDHLPQTPQNRAPDSGANSLAVHASAIKNDIEEDEKMDESCFGDSTVGGTLDGTTGAGWEADDPTLGNSSPTTKKSRDTTVSNSGGGDQGMTLVDHTPSEIGTSTQLITDPSVDVVASEGASKGGEDGDSTVVYGPVVDQTPTTPAITVRNNRSDSVVVLLADEDTMVGESTIGDGTVDEEAAVEESSAVDTLDEADLPGPLRSLEDQLVDHVPNRPYVRYGDASTGVAADPSEVLSEVDDMTQEGGGNFGPVVDLTPQTRLPSSTAELPSGAGSTVAFAPSVPADDLDDADETEVVADEDSWAQEEAEPNPQCGNDEPLETQVNDDANEQLVDFLPPPNDTGVAREALSEMTVGAHSVLQAEDPIEDDFGPVVDQTPAVRSSSALSHASTATIATASECHALEQDDSAVGAVESDDPTNKPAVVVDQLPQMRDRLPADSVATAGQSQLTEEDEEEDDSKFGPVVDHLPNLRHPFAPSRGGSTVDALATVSEANSDVVDGDGWEEDVDFDTSEGCISDGAALSTSSARAVLRHSMQSSQDESSADQERMSVRFEASINDTSPGLSPRNTTQYYDPEHDDQGAISINETQYFDPESGNSSSWNNSLSNPGPAIDSVKQIMAKSFAEADTPPSTPYRRTDVPIVSWKRSPDAKPHPSLPRFQPRQQQSKKRCDRCDNSNAIACPCVQKILKVDGSNCDLMGKVRGPDGHMIEIDFAKLLEEELTKRNLLQEECNALRLIEQSRKTVDMGAESEISKLRHANLQLSRRTSALEEKCKGLEFERLSSQSARSSENLKLQQTNAELLRQADDLRNDRSDLRDKNESLAKELASVQMNQSEVSRLRDANKDLSDRITELKRSCESFRHNKDNISNELASSKDSLARLEVQNSELLEQLSSFENEKQNLVVQLENARDLAASQAENSDSVQLVQHELHAELATLKEQLSSQRIALESRLREASDGASALKDHLDETEKKLEDALAENQSVRLVSEDKLSSLKLEVDALRDANEELLQQKATLEAQHRSGTDEILEKHSAELASLRNLHQTEMQETIEHMERSFESKTADLHLLQAAKDTAEAERDNVLNELSSRKDDAKESAHLLSKLERVSKERDLMQQELSSAQESLVALQSMVDGQELECLDVVSRRDLESETLHANNEDLRIQLSTSEGELRTLKDELTRVSDENTILTKQLAAHRSTCEALEHSSEEAQQKLSREVSRAEVSDVEIERLKDLLTQTQSKLNQAAQEEQTSRSHLAELGRTLKRMGEEANEQKEKISGLKDSLSNSQSLVQTVTQEKEMLQTERDELLSRLTNFQSENNELHERLDSEHDTSRKLGETISKLEEERNQLAQSAQQFHEAIAMLENERDELVGTLKASNRREAELDQQVVSCRRTILENEKSQTHLEEQCSKLREVVNRHKNAAEKLEQELKELGEVDQERTEAISCLELELRELREVCRRHEALTGPLHHERDKLIEENQQRDIALSALQQERTTLQDALRDRENKLLDHEQELDRLRLTGDNLSNLQAELEIERQRANELASERNLLNEENEEMLVQFGLLKQEMDNSERTKNQELDEMQRKTEEVMNKLSAVEQEKVSLGNQLVVAYEENSKLADSFKEMNSARAYEVDIVSENARLSSQMEDLQYRFNQMNEKYMQQAALLAEHDTRVKTEHAEKAREFDDLHRRIERLVADVANIGTERDDLANALKTAREEKDAMAIKLSDFDSSRTKDIDLASENTLLISQIEDLSMQHHEMLEQLQQKEAALEQMRIVSGTDQSENNEEKYYEEKLHQLRKEMTEKDNAFAAKAVELEAAMTEMLADRNKLLNLQDELSRHLVEKEKWKDECSALRVELDRAVQSHRETDEVSSLREQVSSLGIALQGSEDRLASKQHETEHLASEVARLESEMNQQIAISLDNTSSAEAVDMKTLHSHIISLAIALEKSETMRADAIERLGTERHEFAESLRRFSESIKRFYSTVSKGEVQLID